jgi:hypothetical protein
MILVTALSLSDARLYEAADAMGTTAAAQVLHHHAAGRQVRPDLGGAGQLHAGDHRLRHPQGDRRQLQRAGHRRVQAGHRPAGLSKGAVVAILLLAPAVLTFAVDRLRQPAPDRHAHARAVPYGPSPRAARRLMTLFCCVIAVSGAGDAGHGGVRLTRQLLALQPHAQPAPLHDGPGRRRGGRGLRQQPQDGRGHGRCSAPRWCSAAPTCWRRPRAWTTPARAGAPAGHAADGGARPGAGPGLHLLLQRAQQPAQRPVPHDGRC